MMVSPNLVEKKRTWTEEFLLTRQKFFIKIFSILGSVSTITFGVLHSLEKNYFIAIPEIIGGCVFLLTILYLKVSKNIMVAKVTLLLTQMVLLIVMLATGGTANTGIFWYFTFPITAFFLVGKTKGILWLIILYITTLIVFILSTLGWVTIAYSFIEVRQLLASLLILSALVYFHQQAIDKTEEKLTQQASQLEIAKTAIEQEKVRDEALLTSLGEGMITVGSSGKVLIINDAATSLLNLTNRDIIGQDMEQVMLLKDTKGNLLLKEHRPWYLALTKGEKNQGEFICVRSDGSEFPIALVAAPVLLNNQTVAAIELFRDITEEKKLDQAKSEFVALASHQLRTPISAISWFTEMLLHGDSGPITPEQKNHLTQVYASNQRLAAMVDDLLNVSRIEMGNFLVEPINTNLGQLSHEMLLHEKQKYGLEKKLTFLENYDAQIVAIPVDITIMKLIFQNLFANAIKYTPENGTIRVSISPTGQEIVTSANNKDEGILIAIADSGYGIPKDQQQKIFTKLFRADNIKARDTDGTGLGLYIVKSVVEQVGGKIWLESAEGKGTTFFVLLPREGMKERKGERGLIVVEEGKK